MLYNESNAKIHYLADNEIQAVDFLIPERCPNSEIGSITVQTNNSPTSFREEERLYHYYKNKTRDSWLESHIMPEKFEDRARQSGHEKGDQKKFESRVKKVKISVQFKRPRTLHPPLQNSQPFRRCCGKWEHRE